MGIFQLPEDEAPDLIGFQPENLGEFGVQALFRILQEILVGLMEFPTGICQLPLRS